MEGASAEPEGMVLEGLKFRDVGGGGVGKPNGGSIGEYRTDEGFKGLEHCLVRVYLFLYISFYLHSIL